MKDHTDVSLAAECARPLALAGDRGRRGGYGHGYGVLWRDPRASHERRAGRGTSVSSNCTPWPQRCRSSASQRVVLWPDAAAASRGSVVAAVAAPVGVTLWFAMAGLVDP